MHMKKKNIVIANSVKTLYWQSSYFAFSIGAALSVENKAYI